MTDYINGPRTYPTLRDMPGGRLWQNRIRSAKVGPAATVGVWADEYFLGRSLRLQRDIDYPGLPDGLTAEIESIDVGCVSSAPSDRW
jgi:hypothetical protein